jgi:hypothetical protein
LSGTEAELDSDDEKPGVYYADNVSVGPNNPLYLELP